MRLAVRASIRRGKVGDWRNVARIVAPGDRRAAWSRVCCWGSPPELLTVWSRLPSFIISLAMMNIADGMSRWLTKSEKLAVPAVLKTIGNRGIEITDRLETAV